MRKILSLLIMFCLFISIIPTYTCVLAEDLPTLFSTGLTPDSEEVITENLLAKSFGNYQMLNTLPSYVDLADEFPLPGDQGLQGSCVSWALGYALKTHQEYLQYNWDLNNSNHQFSPAYLYNQGIHDCTIIGVANIIKNQGICSLADMPYNDLNDTTQPSDNARNKASCYKANSIAAISYGDIDTMKQCLAAGNGVVISIPYCKDLYYLNVNNPVYDIFDPSTYEGNHAVCLIGYNDNDQTFTFINSWGANTPVLDKDGQYRDWGIDIAPNDGQDIHGYGKISYDFIQNPDTDVYGVTLIDNTSEAQIQIEPYETSPTNQPINVTATAHNCYLSESSYTFTQNGSHTFTATDGLGNTISQTVVITNINENAPPTILTSKYNSSGIINHDVTITATGCNCTLNEVTHTFTQNGSFTFSATDSQGNIIQKTITISNINKNYAFDETTGNITKYTGTDTNITIPSLINNIMVTGIDRFAFSNRLSLVSITIPSSITYIGEGVFYNTSSLNEFIVDNNNPFYCSYDGIIYNKNLTVLIRFPENKSSLNSIPISVTRIGQESFQSCNLTSITIPSNVTAIGKEAFTSCTTLTNLTIPTGVEIIGSYAFKDCASLTNITIPSSVSNLDSTVFLRCLSLTAITVASGNSCFSSENGILYNIDKTELITYPSGKTETYFSIPDNVNNIGDYAFYYCNKLRNINFNNIISIGSYAFYSCSALNNVIIPNSITNIGFSTFAYCNSLTSITIPSSVTSIDTMAFCSCRALTSIIIPSSVTNIGTMAFYNCTSLTSVTIPNSVTYIGDSAFASNSNNLIIYGNDTSYVYTYSINNSINFVDLSRFEFDEASGMITDYYGNATHIFIPSKINSVNVTSIGENAFYSSLYTTNIIIQNGITNIGNNAFNWCTSLETITIPNSVVNIGDWAFSSCTSMENITLPESITSIGTEAFYRCLQLKNIEIPYNVNSIGDEAFGYCTDLTSINVNVNNQYYASQDGVLYNKNMSTIIKCPGGKSGDFIIPATVTHLGNNAFYICKLLEHITIPSSVSNIGNWAFAQCTSLSQITIPGSVTIVGDNAFSSCSSLNNAIITNGVNNIGSSAFANCSSITNINIPSSVTNIGSYAFSNCILLNNISIPNSVISIGNDVFYNCPQVVIYGEDTSHAHTYAINNTIKFVDLRRFVFNDSTGTITDYTGTETNVIIPSTINNISVIGIGDYAFSGCTTMVNITIPNSITSFGMYAFYGCSSLNDIAISNSVTSIGAFSFDYCSSLTQIAVDPNNMNYSSESGVLYNKTKTSIVKCPEGKTGIVAIPSSVTSVGYGVFSNCSLLTEITIPSSVTNIGSNAFSNCSSLLNIIIPSNVSTIGSSAFNGCSALTSITIPASVTSIGSNAFNLCPSLSQITVNVNNLNYSSQNGILYNKNITTLIKCPEAKSGSLTIPSTVTTIGNYAFYYCSSLTGITIPSSVTSIGSYNFYHCSSLTQISVNSSNANYSSQDGVLYNKTKTTLIKCPESKSGSFTIPSAVTSIGSYGFAYCTALTTITIPSSVTSIASNAFLGCTATIIDL